LPGRGRAGRQRSRKKSSAIFAAGAYFNLDNDYDRRIVLKQQWGDEKELVVFDELHKYARWKRWLKGVFDTRPNKRLIL